jgi:hypothetical protein
MGEVGLDRAHAEVQNSGDLLVGPSLGRKRRDALLAIAELLLGRSPPADPQELGPCLIGPQRCAEILENRERPEQRFPSQALAGGLPVDRPGRQKGPAELERKAPVLQPRLRPRDRARRVVEIAFGAASNARAREAAPSTLRLGVSRACISYWSRYARARSSSLTAISASIALGHGSIGPGAR